MKKISLLIVLVAIGGMSSFQTAQAADPSGPWAVRLDLGGTIPEDAELTEFDGPVTGGELKLDPGFQLDVAVGYHITPWLEVGPEIGFTFNFVDSIGDWSYHDITLGQILMMANIRLEYPPRSRLAPFIGAGIGGAASFLTFYGGGYYAYEYPDGTGSDLSLAFQVFGGIRYRIGENLDISLVYRYLTTDPQHWDVEWWDGGEFGVGVDSIRMHSVCLMFSGRF